MRSGVNDTARNRLSLRTELICHIKDNREGLARHHVLVVRVRSAVAGWHALNSGELPARSFWCWFLRRYRVITRKTTPVDSR